MTGTCDGGGQAVLAIEAGATGITALVVASSGEILARGYHEFGREVPQPGWVEHAPEQIWQATLEACRTALRSVDPGRLVGIGITDERETLVLWDRETLGSPRPAIGSKDRRTASFCASMASHEARVREVTGLAIDPSCAATRLAWIREHEEHTWAHVVSGRYAVGTVDSYLVARLTRGVHHLTDVSNASRTLLFDLAGGDWSAELCELFDVPRDALPEIVPSWGELAVSDARSFLDLSLPVAGIAGDRPAALFGQTCFDAGEVACAYGAGAFLLATTGTSVLGAEAGLLPTAVWRSPAGETTYALEGSNVVTDAETLASAARDVVGLMPDVRALAVDSAAGDDLCQLQADLLGIPVARPRQAETAGRGAAYLAGLGVGLWDSCDRLRQLWPLDRTFAPTRDRSDADADA